MMKTKLLILLFIILLITPLIAYAEDSGVTQAVPVNIKVKCAAGFIGEQFCKDDNVYQTYQTNVCVKYSKLIKECSSGEMCINGICTKGNPENAITGAAVTDISQENKGFFSRIWDWFKNLF